MTTLPRTTILIGDVRERLRELPAASVDCIITSPPGTVALSRNG
jgi:site-specific DNA-methyltransferase (adenine-specific)